MASDKTPPRRPRRPARAPEKRPLYAAVDLGTNNCRLLIAERRGAGYQVVDSHSNLARLGEGLAGSGRLSDAAVERGLQAMREIRDKLKRRKVGRVRCIATEACRKAENGRDFIDRVRAETGLTFKIVGPAEEARLAVIGCHDLFDPGADLVMVLDIGGGSTEIAFVEAAAVRERGLKSVVARTPIAAWRSFKIGVVTLTEPHRHLPDADAYAAMRTHAEDVFRAWSAADEFAALIAAAPSHIVGTSGTVTCLAGVHLKLERYRRDAVDGAWMSRAAGRDVVDLMRGLGAEGRAELPTIGPERADLMLAGCAILDAAWSVWPAERLRVADRGLREGLLLSMMHGGPKRTGRRRRGGRGASGPKEAAGHGG